MLREDTSALGCVGYVTYVHTCMLHMEPLAGNEQSETTDAATARSLLLLPDARQVELMPCQGVPYTENQFALSCLVM